jgi:hypothetical protein
MGRSPPENRKGAGARPSRQESARTPRTSRGTPQHRLVRDRPGWRKPPLATQASGPVAISRRATGGSPAGTWVSGIRRACRAFIRAITRLGPNSQFTREQSAKLTAHGDGCRRVQRSPQQGFQPQKPVREPPDPSELREPFTLARRLRPEGCGLRLEGSALSDERAEEGVFAA